MNHSETEHQNSLSNSKSSAGPGPKIELEESWKSRLEAEFATERMQCLKKFLVQENALGKTIFPKGENFFTALNTTSFDRVKVVILGQDPYHGPGQAHGLCFSVPEGIALPPSLVNIYKELQSDLGLAPASSGNLLPWARQGVLLLNSVLTVEAGKAGAHQGRGWEEFTDKIIQLLNAEKEHLVFVLWGAYAQKKAAFVDRTKHLVIESPHPSPLSSYRGFFGSKPFSKINTWLVSKGLAPIDWRLS